MKKILLLFLGLVVCISMIACSLEDTPTKEIGSTSTQETGSASEKEEDAKTTYGLNETAVFNDLKFTASEMKESNGTDFFKPESGNVFVGVNFTVENISDEEQTISSILLFDAYADDVKCEYSLNASCAFSEGQLDGSIAPGKKLMGWYAVEVPENWSTLELNVTSSWLQSKAATFVFNK